MDVEIADTLLKKIRGLMFKNIGKEGGLLLIFKRKGRPGIWMPFVPQDLGLVFLDHEKKVVDMQIAERITLDPDTWQTYKPSMPCKYVLECHPEKLERVEIGDQLEWENG